MDRRFLDQILARENTVVSLVFLLTASAIAAVLVGPTEMRPLGMLAIVAGILVLSGALLHVYCRLNVAQRPGGVSRAAALFAAAIPVMAVASILITHFGIWFGPGAIRSRSFETTLSEYKHIELSDDSTLQLDASTRIRTRMSQQLRQVVLERGGIRVAVTPRKDWPFEVVADRVLVRVRGTQFSVFRRELSSVEVLVAEGQVELELLPDRTTAAEQRTKVTLSGSDRAVVRNGRLIPESSDRG